MGAHVDLPSSTRYAYGWLRFPGYTSMHYINGWGAHFVVATNSPMRVNDSRCRMSDVAFRTARPIGASVVFRRIVRSTNANIIIIIMEIFFTDVAL